MLLGASDLGSCPPSLALVELLGCFYVWVPRLWVVEPFPFLTYNLFSPPSHLLNVFQVCFLDSSGLVDFASRLRVSV